MSELFLKIIDMSISASWLVLAVWVLRLVLKKAPKWVSVMLWGVVAVRLICPFTVESSVSLMPDALGIDELITEWLDEGREPIRDSEGGHYVATQQDQPEEPQTVGDTVMPILSVVWVVGMAGLWLYIIISYFHLYRRVDTAVRYQENIYQSEQVASPFVLGIIRPRIYLPFGLEEQDLEHVVAHEKAHIRRKDHWWKPLGFLLLTIHWFNPLIWLAYILLCRDIELACDEKVIRGMEREQRADYMQALVVCSVNRRRVAACPLAFGEVGVKERVKSVMNYKKPAFWVVILAVIACVAVGVCFLTDPVSQEPDLSFLNYENAISLVADVEEVMVIYCPPLKDQENGLIQIGAATGSELAKQLDQWEWRECKAPFYNLSSPGSVEFVIEEDHRITVHQRKQDSLRRYAVVKYQEEVRYYRIDRNDYQEAVDLVHRAQSRLLDDAESEGVD